MRYNRSTNQSLFAYVGKIGGSLRGSSLTRRDFLKMTGIILGSGLLAGCESQPKSPAESDIQEKDIETPSYSFGDPQAAERILVGYATRTGSTIGVATAIGETLAGRGFAVDVKPLKEAPDLDGYQKVILGSAINGAEWLPEAVEYATNHQQVFRQMPAAIFCVHILNLGDDETSVSRRLAYLDAIRPLLPEAEEKYFAGIGMEPDDPSLLSRWVYQTFSGGGEGDCRDWDDIRSWAQQIFSAA
ncbi:MAG TPA: flavodoxin domain-containing protein [Anaerolineaceae bacterium]|nr:flavodoxin domain-containing protein [Anaerolineaceae bacterium]